MTGIESKRRFDFYQLEDRILLSGEGLDGAEMVEGDPAFAAALMAELEMAEGQVLEDPAVAAVLNPTAILAHDETSEEAGDLADTHTFDPALPLEVVFVDSAVEDAETLLDGLREGGADQTQWLIVELSADLDGIDQITDTLHQLSDVNAIHIVSHGDGSGIQLGDTRLDVDSAAGYASEIASWAGSLDADADLLIYGCDLADTTEGRALIESIGALCDCDVAASDDSTGHEDRGGDWILEYVVGDVSTDVAFGYVAQASWQGTLDITTGLVGHWELDDGSGTTADDATANNNDGTVNGTAIWTSGEIGGAFEFNYRDGEDYIEIPNSASLENVQENDYTLAAWFRPDSTPPGTGSDSDANYGILIKTGLAHGHLLRKR